MPNVGDIRWYERITVDGNKVTKREKVLQQYRKYYYSWGDKTEGWEDIGIHQHLTDQTDWPEIEKECT